MSFEPRDPNWPMRADEREHIGWAEYVQRWLAEQTPHFQPKTPTPPARTVAAEEPWVTGCLMDVLNG